MTEYIPLSGQPTASWLTAVLRQSGVLQRGAVTSVTEQMTGAFNSHTSHLVLRYSADAPPGMPARLVLKRNASEAWSVEAGVEEVKFYNLIAALPRHPPAIVPCYAAAYDEASGNSYVLLLDISETHQPPITRDQQISIVEGVPSEAYIDSVVDTLAQTHAYWWEHSLLNTATFAVGYWSHTAERFAAYVQRRQTSWAGLIANEGNWFPDELRALYKQLFAALPHYWEQQLAPRFQSKSNLTLIHGDSYFSNFLCPKNPGSAPTYLLDWQSPAFDIAGYDLANLCAAVWTSEQRHEDQREQKILQRYLAALQAYGVQHYSWQDLVTDYQHGLIFWLLMPVQDGYDGAGKDYWWPKMQCLAAAFKEWQCEELLGIA